MKAWRAAEPLEYLTRDIRRQPARRDSHRSRKAVETLLLLGKREEMYVFIDAEYATSPVAPTVTPMCR